MLLITRTASYLAQGQAEEAASLLAGAGRLRSLLGIPSQSEEQTDRKLLEARISEEGACGLLESARLEQASSGPDELVARLLPLL